MKQIKLGDLTVKKIVEKDQGVHDPLQFFPAATKEAIDAQREWAEPYFLTDDGQMRISIHSYLVETKRRKILVDTCIGVHGGPEQQARNQIDETAFLRALKSAGATPPEIDVVLCTHMHFDHTGWNTRLENGMFVPTFPNATYVFSRPEYEHWKDIETDAWNGFSIHECVNPIVEAGRAMLVEPDYVLEDGLSLEHVPGHTPGAVCLNLESKGERAAMFGDMMHHPLQIGEPGWTVGVDTDQAQAAKTRTAFLERHADSNTIMMAAHFAGPTIGRVATVRGAWRLNVIED